MVRPVAAQGEVHRLVCGHEERALASLRKEILRVDAERPMPERFDALTTDRAHVAVVMDASGGVAGLVTTEDVPETLCIIAARERDRDTEPPPGAMDGAPRNLPGAPSI